MADSGHDPFGVSNASGSSDVFESTLVDRRASNRRTFRLGRHLKLSGLFVGGQLLLQTQKYRLSVILF